MRHPCWTRGLCAARTLKGIECLGVEDVVAGEKRKDDNSRAVARDEVLQHQQLLLRPEAGGAIVLHRPAQVAFEPRRP
jgi:hypothetical protein